MIKPGSKSFATLKPSSKRQTSSTISTKKSSSVSKQKSDDIILNVAAAFGQQALLGKSIDFKVQIKCTNEIFNIVKFPLSMKIRDLKSCLEFICGVPYNLQRLSYLDDGELIDSKDIQYYDIIEGGVVIMDIWTIYLGLVQICSYGTIEDALKQGVSMSVEWKSPTSDYMFTRDKGKYVKERGGIALFIASHRGNLDLVKGLLSHGADINYKSALGRTALMVSVVANKTDIIEYLLENNANIDLVDINGDTALSIAKKFNNKLGQHKLTQFKWKKRTEAELKSKNKDNDDEIFPEKRLPHQIFDSSKKTWIKGKFMQMYMMQLVPQREFSGSGLSAPKSVGKEVLKAHKQNRSISDLKMSTIGDDDNEEGATSPLQTGLSFDKWLAQKLKAKKLEQQKLKKAEAEKELENSREDFNKETTNSINLENDNNLWMKDYSKPNIGQSKLDPFDLNKKETNISLNSSNPMNTTNNFTSASMGSMNTNRSGKNLDLLEIYKGMSYEEWTKIRDSFLKSHNMI
ncbi:unnamed protein product [Brachionus calyciflorus]|uniref:Ubiquitin-like domain-containing protein n=1 Tax=Brachionus calyciflorus TaxID=104777 RepID=A0A814BZT4_9BILA|nr:unnamed protein product [Brachionus calyciflorus]